MRCSRRSLIVICFSVLPALASVTPAFAKTNSAMLYTARMSTAHYLKAQGCKLMSGYYKYVPNSASCTNQAGKVHFQISSECHGGPSATAVTCRWYWSARYPQSWVSVRLQATKVSGKFKVTVTDPWTYHPPETGGIIF